MKIYTKTGDSGETSLLSGKRVKKHHLRIDTYGEVDHLNSIIGLSISQAQSEFPNESNKITDSLTLIQHELFNLGSLLACDTDSPKLKLPQITLKNIEAFETLIDQWSEELPLLKEFILPGGNLTASTLNIARTCCRKCERLTSKLAESESLDENILIYLNRLSDFLFTASRYANFINGTSEVTWKKGN